MHQRSRVDVAVSEILDRIACGEFVVGERVPGQDELAALLGVSRLTVREAVKDLSSGHILRVEHGNGTFVNPPSRWTDVGAIIRVGADPDRGATERALVEVRRMIEVGAAELAAARRTPEHLLQLEHHVAVLADATAADDLELFVEHDLAFHDTILRACDNPFLGAVFDPLGRALASGRRRTSAVPEIRRHALWHHRAILAAITASDAPGAARAMSAHMDQTAADLASFVLRTGD